MKTVLERVITIIVEQLGVEEDKVVLGALVFYLNLEYT